MQKENFELKAIDQEHISEMQLNQGRNKDGEFHQNSYTCLLF